MRRCDLVRPGPWLAALALVLMPCAWIWSAAAVPGDSVQVGSAVQLAIIAMVAWPVLRGLALAWHRAILPVGLALAWMGASQIWSPVPEQGMQQLVLRCAAASAALTWMAWLVRQPEPGLARACGVAGLGILAVTVATQAGPGAVLGIGASAPFGNANYSAHIALPLIAIAVAYDLRTSPKVAVAVAVPALLLAAILGLGLINGDACRAAWLGLASSLVAILVLRAPQAWHGGLIVAGLACALTAWWASFHGALDPQNQDWSTAQRIYMWRAAVECLDGPALVLGHGAGACLPVLPEQPSFQGFWLTLPGWTSHPHNELLAVLLDGGVVLAVLLAWAVSTTLLPLWRRRDEPLCAALLVGWAVLGCGAMVETHLREPGGVLLLALLAGASWAQAPMTTAAPVRPVAWLLILSAGALALCALRELWWDGGPAQTVAARAQSRIAATPADDHRHRQHAYETLRRRLGPLDDVDFQISVAIGSQGRLIESVPPLIGQLARMPCYAPALDLAARLRRAGVAPPDLLAAEEAARSRAAHWLELIPENARNRDARRALERSLQSER